MPFRSLLFIFLCFAQILTAQVSTVGLRLENTINPIGIDVPSPRFSWQLSSPQRGVLQLAYEIKMATDIAF